MKSTNHYLIDSETSRQELSNRSIRLGIGINPGVDNQQKEKSDPKINMVIDGSAYKAGSNLCRIDR